MFIILYLNSLCVNFIEHYLKYNDAYTGITMHLHWVQLIP